MSLLQVDDLTALDEPPEQKASRQEADTSTWTVACWRSIAQLRGHARQWDDLWRRSPVATPSCRAEPLAVWLEHFAPEQPLEIWVAQTSDGRLLAALPLLADRGRGLPRKKLPQNDWSPTSDLLIDPSANAADILPDILAAAGVWPSLWLWFGKVPIDSQAWTQWQRVARQAGAATFIAARDPIGIVDIDHDWPAYEASRSKNLRKQMRQIDRRLDRCGGSALRIEANPAESEIERLLRQGFEVEDRSWKGEAGSSVLRKAGMFEFYVRQASALAQAGHLHLVFLEHAGRTIAFEYGWSAKGVYFSPKVGYDPEFAEYCPGQFLRWKLLELFQGDPGTTCVDFMGPLVHATSRWTTRTYTVADLWTFPPGVRAHAAIPLVAARKLAKRILRGQHVDSSSTTDSSGVVEPQDISDRRGAVAT